MTDEQDSSYDDDDLIDLGDPIVELKELGEDPKAGFVSRLINSLRRRDLSAQLVTLSWTGLGTVLLEFLQALFSVFDTNRRDPRGED